MFFMFLINYIFVRNLIYYIYIDYSYATLIKFTNILLEISKHSYFFINYFKILDTLKVLINIINCCFIYKKDKSTKINTTQMINLFLFKSLLNLSNNILAYF